MTRASAALALLLAVMVAPVAAQEFRAGPITVSQAWARLPPQGAKVAGAYMAITNTGTATDRLIGGSAEIAEHLEIHEMSMTDGIMRMRALARGLEIQPGETVLLKPGSYHVMLLGLKAQPVLGGLVEGTLVFEKAGPVAVAFRVEAMGAATAGQHATPPGQPR